MLSPTPEMVSAALEKLDLRGDAKADDQVPKTELAAWTMVCSQLLNLDEILNK